MIENNEKPYITSAFLCERTLEEKDEALSVIRIVDRVTITGHGDEAAEVMPPFKTTIFAVLAFISGPALGKRIVGLRMIQPDNQPGLTAAEIPVVFDGEQFGVRVIVTLQLQIKKSGIYWFDVLLNNERVTRMAYEVRYIRARDEKSEKHSQTTDEQIVPAPQN